MALRLPRQRQETTVTGTFARLPAAVQSQLGLSLSAWQIPFLQADQPSASSAAQGTEAEIEANIAGNSCFVSVSGDI